MKPPRPLSTISATSVSSDIEAIVRNLSSITSSGRIERAAPKRRTIGSSCWMSHRISSDVGCLRRQQNFSRISKAELGRNLAACLPASLNCQYCAIHIHWATFHRTPTCGSSRRRSTPPRISPSSGVVQPRSTSVTSKRAPECLLSRSVAISETNGWSSKPQNVIRNAAVACVSGLGEAIRGLTFSFGNSGPNSLSRSFANTPSPSNDGSRIVSIICWGVI